MSLSYLLLLSIAVSMDGFFAGIAYGLKKINVPYAALYIIAFVIFCCTATAISAADILLHFITPKFAALLSATLLILLGLTSLFSQHHKTTNPPSTQEEVKNSTLRFTFSLGRLVINIMEKPERADLDNSCHLCKSEAVLLGLALGLDNMAAVFAICITQPLPVCTPVFMCIVQTTLVAAGIYCVKYINKPSLKTKIAYAPGLILLLLGFLRLW